MKDAFEKKQQIEKLREFLGFTLGKFVVGLVEMNDPNNPQAITCAKEVRALKTGKLNPNNELFICLEERLKQPCDYCTRIYKWQTRDVVEQLETSSKKGKSILVRDDEERYLQLSFPIYEKILFPWGERMFDLQITQYKMDLT